MIKIENHMFEIKSSETNLRQRMYKGESIVSIQIMIECFPTLVADKIVSGAVEIKVDIPEVHSLHDFEGKTYEGDIGNVTISVNNMGVWEYKSLDTFKIVFKKRKGRELSFSLQAESCEIEDKTTLISLYTTSTCIDDVKKNFDLEDFYDVCVEREVGKSHIYKYYVKEKV